VAKYDSAGNAIWGKDVGAMGSGETGKSISTDMYGNVYMAGGYNNVVIAKYDPLGNIIWSKNPSGSDYESANCVSSDEGGNTYITGEYRSPILVFGNDTLINPNPGGYTVFIARYDSSGNVKWVTNGVGINNYGMGITTDTKGNAYATGYFISPTISFGSYILNNINGAGVPGDEDLFIVKYDSSGNVKWAESTGGRGLIEGIAISTDANGDVYLTGNFSNTVYFGNDTLIDTSRNSSLNVFIAKYNASGNVIWGKSALGAGTDYTYGICTNTKGDAMITGEFQGSGIIFGRDSLTSTGNINVFVAKIASPIPTTDIVSIKPSSKIIIYPNPSTGNFYFSGLQSGNTIEVYNVLGEKVYASQSNGSNFLVSLSGQSKGMYFYKISNSSVIIQQGKMILE